MVKLIFCLRRLPHLSREEFQNYWLETHGPLVRERAAAIGARRYVQLHTRYDEMNAGLQASRGGPEPYDGVAELWFESVDAIGAGLSTNVGRRAAAVAVVVAAQASDLREQQQAAAAAGSNFGGGGGGFSNTVVGDSFNTVQLARWTAKPAPPAAAPRSRRSAAPSPLPSTTPTTGSP